MSYISAVQYFIGSNFDSYIEGKDWVKRVYRGLISIDENDCRIKKLREIIQNTFSDKSEERPSLRKFLQNYIQDRKSLPITVVAKDGVKVCCYRSLFKKEVRRPLKYNEHLLLPDVSGDDVITASSTKEENRLIDVEYFKRNYRWLTTYTTLSIRLYDVWIEHIKTLKHDSAMLMQCIDSFVKDRVFTPSGVFLFKRALRIIRSIKISFHEDAVVNIESGFLSKKASQGIRKCLNSFQNVNLKIKQHFDINPCLRFQKLLLEVQEKSNVETLSIDHSLQNSDDKTALLNLIRTSKHVTTVETCVIDYTNEDAKALLKALESSRILEDFFCNAEKASNISDDLKRALKANSICFISLFMNVLKGLAKHNQDIAIFYQDLSLLSMAEQRRGIVEYWKFFDQYVTGDLLRLSKEAMDVYRKLLQEFPLFINPFKIYFLNIPRPEVIRGTSLSPKVDDSTVSFVYPDKGEPEIVDQRLAHAYSSAWFNGAAIVDVEDPYHYKKIIEFIRTGKWQIYDCIYVANDIHETAVNNMMILVKDEIENFIMEYLAKYQSILDLYLTSKEIVNLENKIFSSLLFIERSLKIKNVNIKVHIDISGKIFLGIRTFDRKIVKGLHDLMEFGGLKGLTISNLDEKGWRRLKGFLIHYPDADLKIRVPLIALASGFDRRHMPQKHLDAMYEPFRLIHMSILAKVVGREHVVHS